MTNEMKDVILDKLRDFKFKGLNYPSMVSANLPNCDSIPSATVTIHKDKFRSFRDAYLFLQIFATAVFNKSDVSSYDIECLVHDLCKGRRTVEIKEIK